MQEDTEVSDSAELLAIRTRDARCDPTVIPNPRWRETITDRRALLRMVDELTDELAQVRQTYDENYRALHAERGELTKERATFGQQARDVASSLIKRTLKLTETEIERDQLRGALQSAVACEAGWIEGARKLQAENIALSEKLAEAMSALDKAAVSAGQQFLEADAYRKRAEAAEARVRKLTDALFAATGGHVDLDRLVP